MSSFYIISYVTVFEISQKPRQARRACDSEYLLARLNSHWPEISYIPLAIYECYSWGVCALRQRKFGKCSIRKAYFRCICRNYWLLHFKLLLASRAIISKNLQARQENRWPRAAGQAHILNTVLLSILQCLSILRWFSEMWPLYNMAISVPKNNQYGESDGLYNNEPS